MKIAVIAGSMRLNSFSSQTSKLAMKALSNKGADIEILDLKNLSLPFCNGSRDYPSYPDVQRLKDAILSANGLLIVTPEYHGSLSGVLKNALDLLDESHFRGKTVALIAVMGGIPSNNAINTLRIIFRQLHAWVLPEQLIIPNIDDTFDENGEFLDPLLAARLDEMADHLIKMTEKLS